MTFATDAPSADSGPGFLAFLAFFALAVALWFLMRNMNARMRRMSYRQQAAGRGKNDPQADGSVPAATPMAGADGPATGRSDGGDRPAPDPTSSDGPSHGGDSTSSGGGWGGDSGGGDGGGGGGGD